MKCLKARKISTTEMSQRRPPNQTLNSDYIVSRDERILVTGSSGFIGSKVVERLLDYGFTDICCFVRPSSRLDRFEKALSQFDAGKNVEIVTGDLLSPTDCRKASAGASIIYHLAAGMEKSFAGAFMNSALATRNLMDAFLRVGEPKRFVNVSSFAVYSNVTLKRGALLDETCPLEDAPQERFDAYGFGKLKQEELVREYGEKHKLPYVILRPGYVFGPGKTELNGRVGINTFGVFIQVNGSHLLPLTYVDNCAEAIVLAGLKAGIDGEIFNVVDDELMTGRQFLKAYRKETKSLAIRIPYFVGYSMSLLWEKYCEWSKNQVPPAFNRRRCAAEWKGNRYSNQKLKEWLGWGPRVPMEQAMALFLSQFEANGDSLGKTTEDRGRTAGNRQPSRKALNH
jgi:nucleoside-diphosphate-sugar epimerase